MIIVNARRWFDKVNGNTYHSVQVFKNDKLIGETPFCYGYGDQYKQTAYGICVANNSKVKVPEYYSDFVKDHKKVLFFCTDVQRKRDL